MKLTAKIKLHPSEDQHQLLLQTLERANTACNSISEQAWTAKHFRRVPVHQLMYLAVREQFHLGAQMAIRCIGKVVDVWILCPCGCERGNEHRCSRSGCYQPAKRGSLG
jgi:predicted transposase